MPVTIKGTGGEVRFNPKTVRIEVVAPKRLFAQLSQEKFQVEIDVAGLKPGVYELTPRVVLNPEYQNTVSIKEVIPERIHVRIL